MCASNVALVDVDPASILDGITAIFFMKEPTLIDATKLICRHLMSSAKLCAYGLADLSIVADINS